jgi:Mor family transcriptional regulator
LKYRNAKTILPERLLRELQQYVQGEILYVPGREEIRAGWGESNGTREMYKRRNAEIVMLYRSGISVEKIAERYNLSEYSIKKIICRSKHKASEYEKVIG